MTDWRQQLEELRDKWERIIAPYDQKLAERLTEIERAALYSSLPDCLESFAKILYDLMPALLQASQNDYERLHDLFYDIGGVSGELEHIMNHVQDARKAFDVLLRLLDEKTRGS